MSSPPLHVAVLVNDVDDVRPPQTTAMLIGAAADRGHDVRVFGVTDLDVETDDRITAHAARAERTHGSLTPMLEALNAAPRERVALDDVDVLLLRTNPARDPRGWAHDTALMLARLLRERGLLVLNDPDGLVRASSKLYLSEFPQAVRPTTLITRDVARIESFLEAEDGPVVLKPLVGTRGRDVFKIDPDRTANLRAIADVLTRDGYAMVQSFLPEARAGDTRVVVMDGEVLAEGDAAVAVRRVPHPKDFRSNIHAGGHAERGEVTDAMRAAIEQIGPRLVKDGIFLAGLDFIGDRVVELNVFSTGGFRDAERFTGVKFSGRVIEAVERKVLRGR